MSPGNRSDVVRAVFAAYNAREFDLATPLLAEDLELVNMATGEAFRGWTGYLQYAQGWVAAFPDSHLEITQLEAGPEAVTVELVGTGTHTGTLVGTAGQIPATGRGVEVRFCDVLRVEDGRVRRWRTYFDTGSLMRQMGLLPNSPLHARDRRAALDLYAEIEGSAQQGNQAAVRRFLEEVVNRKNLALASELCVPNLIWHGGTIGEIRDLKSFQQVLSSLFAAFPDLRIEVADTLAEGDRVAVRATLRGTHEGDFQGVPPTGRCVTISGTSLYRVVNGRIVEEWWQYDLLDLMRQLDAIPAMVRMTPSP